jgi:hypothetical protein
MEHSMLQSLNVSQRNVNHSIEHTAQRCLAEAGNNPDRAIKLAGKYARGAKLRAVVVAIANARESASAT